MSLQAIIVILQKMPIASYSRMMEWIHTFSRTAKVTHSRKIYVHFVNNIRVLKEQLLML